MRVIVDSRLRTPTGAKVIKDQNIAKTLITTTAHADSGKLSLLKGLGVDTLVIEEDTDHRVDLKKLFAELGRKNISSVLVEGGSAIITSLLRENLPDRVVIVIAPKIIGKGIEAVGDLGTKTIDESLRIAYRKILRKGADIILDGRIQR